MVVGELIEGGGLGGVGCGFDKKVVCLLLVSCFLCEYKDRKKV